MNDLRAPLGFFFSLVGLILLGVAFFAPEAHARLTTVDVNLDTGIVILVFGGLMLWLARKSF